MKQFEYLLQEDIDSFEKGEATRAYNMLGCHYIKKTNQYRFSVWAPNAKSVCVVGDFNNWDTEQCPMQRGEGGIFVAFLSEIKQGDNYKYFITAQDDTTCYKADPYGYFAEVRPATASKVWDIEGYEWTDTAYLQKREQKNVRTSPMSVYELHLGSWKVNEDEPVNVAAIADDVISYVKKMGFTHIELMPITEFPYDGSWGYQVTGYFATTSRFGTPQDYMTFVDKCHKAGIGVILDWVGAHFPKDEHGLADFDGTKLYEHLDPRQGEHPHWGTLIYNYGRGGVMSFLISSIMFFMDKYHVDGVRLDAVSSMLYLDFGKQEGEWVPNPKGGNINLEAVSFLQKLNHAVLTAYPGTMTIAEESTAFPLVTKPAQVGGLGFSFKWNMGFMNDMLSYMSMDHLFRKDNHNKLTFSMTYAYSENYILPFSHDEVVHGKGSMINKMFGSYEEKFDSLRAFYGFVYGHPGKKLLFMGDEFAQFIEWDYQKELDWFLHEYPSHDSMSAYVSDLNHLYKKYRALYQIEDSWDGFQWQSVDDNENSVVSFVRSAKPHAGKTQRIMCVINFTPIARADYKIGIPFEGEKLNLLLNSDEEKYGGSGEVVSQSIKIVHTPWGEFDSHVSLTLPPLSAMFFEIEQAPKKSKKASGKAVSAKSGAKKASGKAVSAKSGGEKTATKKTATKKTGAKKPTEKKPSAKTKQTGK